MVLETMVYSPLNHLTCMIAREYVTESSRHGRFKLHFHFFKIETQ
jgi:hypothetical protein